MHIRVSLKQQNYFRCQDLNPDSIIIISRIANVLQRISCTIYDHYFLYLVLFNKLQNNNFHFVRYILNGTQIKPCFYFIFGYILQRQDNFVASKPDKQ